MYIHMIVCVWLMCLNKSLNDQNGMFGPKNFGMVRLLLGTPRE